MTQLIIEDCLPQQFDSILISKTAAYIRTQLVQTPDADHVSLLILATHPAFRSTDYKMRTFQAASGFTLHSRNSPTLLDASTLFLHGSYDEFNYKPLYLKLPAGEGTTFLAQLDAAIGELSSLIALSPAPEKLDFRPAQPSAVDLEEF